MNNETGLIKLSPGVLAGLAQGGLGLDVFVKDILVLECLVAGTSFRKLDGVAEKLVKETRVELKREAANEHDGWAVALYFDGKKIGYIPRDKNEVIARLLDAGKTFFGKVCEAEMEGNWLKVEVEIFLRD